MQLELRRDRFNSECTTGRLMINGIFECYTLEDVVREDGRKIYGETAIPAGKYVIDITMSPRFKVMMPILLAVEGFEGIRIHPGNNASHTEGCLLVGQDRTDTSIGRSVAAYDALFRKLRSAKNRGEKIEVNIINMKETKQ